MPDNMPILQIVLAVMTYFALGALWYSPAFFAKPWLAALGKRREDINSGTATPFVSTLLAMVVAVTAEAYIMGATETTSAWAGARLGLVLALGFAGTTAFINSTFQHRPIQLYLIDVGYHAVGLSVAGAILAA